MRSASGIHNRPLVGWTKGLGNSGQCSLDQPRFEHHPCGFAVRIEFLGHPQHLGGAWDTSGCYGHPDDAVGTEIIQLLLFSDLFEHVKGGARCSAVAFDRPFGELQQKCLGRRHAAFDAVLSDRQLTAKHSLIGYRPRGRPAGFPLRPFLKRVVIGGRR
jgi:hypothetical protein